MKPFFKVLLAGAAVLGVAKVAKAKGMCNGKCKNHQNNKLAKLDKIRNMSDEQYAQFKEDIKNRDFRKIRKRFTEDSSTAENTTTN